MTLLAVLPPLRGESAPYAAMVMDARTGEVLHSKNADTRLHPASLTKMMTLYIAFEAIKNGEISLDTVVTISSHAANEPPSKLGLRPGHKIKLRYLIRAAAIKSANDAATAIGEAIEGSEAAFARRMNRTAKAIGMTRTTFKNANGLTEEGHLSTAHDMTILGRQLFFDYPDYYNLFSRLTADAGGRAITNTNTRFLTSYKGADGIKTGYTAAAGFNLVASAQHGNERIIATVFGGVSSAARNAKMAELMDLGFARAPSSARVNRPPRPNYSADPGPVTGPLLLAVKTSPIPVPRPSGAPALTDEFLVAMTEQIQDALQEVQPEVARLSLATDGIAPVVSPIPTARPDIAPITLASAAPVAEEERAPEIVTRISTSGGRLWGINIGRYPTSFEAERELLKTALREIGTLDEALRKVVLTNRGFEANFVGMSEEMAALACRRLDARGQACTTIGP